MCRRGSAVASIQIGEAVLHTEHVESVAARDVGICGAAWVCMLARLM